MLSSCTYYTYYVPEGSSLHSGPKAETIKIYSGDIDANYTEIAVVAIIGPDNGDAVVNTLKRKVSKLGANAIIHAKLTKLNALPISTGISGVAVRVE